jgi:GNAT superfamily N-acetyltransferase
MRHQENKGHLHGALSSAELDEETWPDFERLFASNGGVWGGCWCMFFHKRGSFDSKAYDKNKDAKEALAREGRAHGTIVYCGDEPVGWCQFGPKEELARIDGKRGYTPTIPDPWRITCLFVAPGHRRSGVAKFAVQESVRYMKGLKAKVVEAYPVEGERSATLLWMGTPGLYEREGFIRVGPFGKHSWVYSLSLSGRRSSKTKARGPS